MSSGGWAEDVQCWSGRKRTLSVHILSVSVWPRDHGPNGIMRMTRFNFKPGMINALKRQLIKTHCLEYDGLHQVNSFIRTSRTASWEHQEQLHGNIKNSFIGLHHAFSTCQWYKFTQEENKASKPFTAWSFHLGKRKVNSWEYNTMIIFWYYMCSTAEPLLTL